MFSKIGQARYQRYGNEVCWFVKYVSLSRRRYKEETRRLRNNPQPIEDGRTGESLHRGEYFQSWHSSKFTKPMSLLLVKFLTKYLALIMVCWTIGQSSDPCGSCQAINTDSYLRILRESSVTLGQSTLRRTPMGFDSGRCSLSRHHEGHCLDDPKNAVLAPHHPLI